MRRAACRRMLTSCIFNVQLKLFIITMHILYLRMFRGRGPLDLTYEHVCRLSGPVSLGRSESWSELPYAIFHNHSIDMCTANDT